MLNHNQTNEYLTDQEFFFYIKVFYLLILKTRPPKKIVKLNDFMLGDRNFEKVFELLTDMDEFDNYPVYNSKDYDYEDLVKIKETIANLDPSYKEEAGTILNNFANGKTITLHDAFRISRIWPSGTMYDLAFDVDNYSFTEKQIEYFQNRVHKYLQNLIDNKLQFVRKHYYKFEIQKENLINLVKHNRNIDLFGKNFILTEAIDGDGNLVRNQEFCFVQSLYALQKLGYLEVINIWDEMKSKNNSNYIIIDDESQIIRNVHVNISLKQPFIDEVNTDKKSNEIIYQGFDKKTGQVKFSTANVSLSSGSKQTDAVLLMEALDKNGVGDWIHNDEIFDVLGLKDVDRQKAAKNKFYKAAIKIKEKIAIKVHIEDFLEFSTEKFRINPIYTRKI